MSDETTPLGREIIAGLESLADAIESGYLRTRQGYGEDETAVACPPDIVGIVVDGTHLHAFDDPEEMRKWMLSHPGVGRLVWIDKTTWHRKQEG